MSNILLVNLSKNTKYITLNNAEAARFGHNVWNLADYPRPEHKALRHIEYCPPNERDFINRIHEMVIDHDIDYVATQCEVLYPMLDKLRVPILPKMRIPVDDIVNKEKYARFCFWNGIDHPATIIPDTLEDIENTFDGAIFVKPTNGCDGSRRLYLTEDKYSMFDYMRYDSPRQFLDALDRYEGTDDFLDTQRHGKHMRRGKGLIGIKGRHMVQECVVGAKDSYAINVIVTKDDIQFIMICHCGNIFSDKMFYFSDTTNTTFIPRRDTNHKEVQEYLGDNAFSVLLETLHKIRQGAGIELALINLHMIEYAKGKYYIQDLQLRPGGSMALTIKVRGQGESPNYKKVNFHEVDYPSIWEYV